jgi:hypothetical protein
MTALRRVVGAAVRCWASTGTIAFALLAVFNGPAALTGRRSLGILGLSALLTAGYGATLWLGRQHLRDDAHIGSRRDLIAGFLAIVLLLAGSVLTQGASTATVLALCLLAGVISAMLMYFPWLQRHRSTQPTHVDA